MKNCFAFRPVGQGLFYTGVLADGEYSFVYDCGTEDSQEYIERELDEFVPISGTSMYSRSGQKNVEFVVISHLHKDHFNGLVSLMNHANVHKVFLPYLGRDNPNLLRLIIAYTITADGNEEFRYDERNQGLYNLIISLYDRKQGRETTVEFLGEEYNTNSTSSRFITSVKKITAANENKSYWEFLFLNKRLNDGDLKKLENEVISTLNILGVDTIDECIRSDEGIKKIQNAYEKIFGKGNKLNLTSTIMMHYPVFDSENKFNIIFAKEESCQFSKNSGKTCIEKGTGHCFHWYLKRTKSIVSVLTGDAELDNEMRTIMQNELKDKWGGVLQIPHHGAKANWESLGKLQSQFACYVVSFGLGNKHKHPNANVINDILKSETERMLYFATQARIVQYKIEI